MVDENPYSLDPAADTGNPDAPRRKKLGAFGLGGLVRQPSIETPGLDQAPLYGGDVNKSAAVSAEEPSQLSTERVQRAPYGEQSTPLLGQEERLGNAVTGETEQNTYQPLSQDERSNRIKNFLNTATQSGLAAESAGTQAASGGPSAADNANEAIRYAQTANKVGTKLGKSLSDLMGTGAAGAGAFEAAFPKGLSLYGSGVEGFPINPQGFNFNEEGAAPILDPSKFNLGGEAAGQAGNIGGYIGAAGAGVGAALNVASLINSIASGQNDTSKTGSVPNTAMNLGISALPILEALIPGLTGLSGLGLAATPMLIPAIMSIIDMFKDPNLPYNSGNISQYRSRAAADQIPSQLNDFLLSQNDPMSLIALATGAKPLSPNQEIIMKAGGNPWQTDPYNAMLEGVLQQDPQAIQDFLRSVEITAGETGGVHNVSTQATDTYRRQLAHALGLTPDQTEGMFQPNQTPFFDREMQALSDWQTGVRNMGVTDLSSYIPELEQGMRRIQNEFTSPDYSSYGQSSPYYQTAPGNINQDQAATLMGLYQSLIDQARQPTPQYLGGDQ